MLEFDQGDIFPFLCFTGHEGCDMLTLTKTMPLMSLSSSMTPMEEA